MMCTKLSAFVAAACILLGPIGSAAFVPQPKLSPFGRASNTPVDLRIQDLHRAVFTADASSYTKTFRPLYAVPPDYSSLANYAGSLAKNPSYEVSWLLGLVTTIFLFVGIFSDDVDDVNGGFCVTGYDSEGSYTKGDVIVKESHTLAWYVDAALLLPAIGVPILASTGVDIPDLFGIPYKGGLDNIIIAVFLIGFHGVLHGFELAKFYDPPNDSEGIVPADGEEEDNTLFRVLAYAITFASIDGYSSLPDVVNLPALVGIVFLVGTFISKLTENAVARGLNPISVFFAATQLLVTGVAAIVPNTTTADALMGWTFAITCLISLLEFYTCEKLLRRIGGHAWYDFALHISVLTSYWILDESPVTNVIKSLSI